MRTRLLAATAAIAGALALAQGPAQAATIILGPTPGFSCGPSGCVDPKTHGFSHALDLTGLSGWVTISGLTFDRSLLGKFGNSMLHITFWTNNGQTLVDDFGNYLAGVLGGDELTLNGHMFVWDGSNGDLTFKIEIVDWNNQSWFNDSPAGGGGGGGSPNGHHDDDDGGGQGHSGDGGPHFDAPQSFVTTDVSAVPEPASWGLMILGLGGLGAGLRSRRRAFA